MSNTRSAPTSRQRPSSRRSARSGRRTFRSMRLGATKWKPRGYSRKWVGGDCTDRRPRRPDAGGPSDGARVSVALPAARAGRIDGVAVAAALATLICAAPALAVFALALAPGREAVSFGGHLLADGAIGTISLMLAGGGGAIVFGAAAAWLVSLCRFPGRGLFEWMLVVPLAAPSYVLAYSYA